MFAHPELPSVMLLPQYSQVIIISPNLGAIGAPQLGHFSDVEFEGATTWTEVAVPLKVGFCAEGSDWLVLAPHFRQNAASSGS